MAADTNPNAGQLTDAVIEEFSKTHLVFTEEELVMLLQQVAAVYLEEGFSVAQAVIENVHDGGGNVGKAKHVLEYAAGKGRIVEVATEQARRSVTDLSLDRYRQRKASNHAF